MKLPSRIALFGASSGLLWSSVAIFCSARTTETYTLFPLAGIIAGILMSFALYRPLRRLNSWVVCIFGILMLTIGAFCFGACTALLQTAGRFIRGSSISFGDALLGPFYSGLIYAYGATIVSVLTFYGIILFPSAMLTTYLFRLAVLYEGKQKPPI